MDEQANQGILVILARFQTSENFLKKHFPSVLSTYGPSTSCKIWDKSNEPVLRKNAAIMDEQINWTILGFFGLISHKQKIFQKIPLGQFWVLMAPQLHAKFQTKTNESTLEKVLL